MTDGEMKPEAAPGEPRTNPIDFKAEPAAALRTLKDPAGGLEAIYRPGQPALLHGLIAGGAAAILIPLVQAIVSKLAWGFAPAPGMLLRQVLGGIVFLAVMAGMSFVLRGALLRSSRPDFKDDVFLAGSSMLFLLAGVIGGSVFSLFGETFFLLLGRTVNACGWLLAGFTYYFGLRRVAKAETGPAVWVTVIVLGVATLMGALLHFSVEGPNPAAIMQSAIQRETQGLFEGLRSLQNQ
jgi:hypothetical protein